MAAPKPERIDPVEAQKELLSKFEDSQRGLAENRAYYESEQRPTAIGIAVPPEMRRLLAHVGYPRIYVNSLCDRLEVTGFRLGGSGEADSVLWDWWQANNLDVEAPLGHADALIHGRAYLTASRPSPYDLGVDPEIPILRVEPPTSLYAEVHPRTRVVTKAIRVANGVTESTKDTPTFCTVYTPDETVYFERLDSDWKIVEKVAHGMGAVPVVPLANRSRLSDLLGTSEITPEIRSATDAAARILMDMQGAAELMAVPQRVIFGARESDFATYTYDEDTGEEQVHRKSAMETYLAHMLAIEDPNGKVMQLSAADLRNYTEALNGIDRKIIQYTGLPDGYLGIGGSNPPSADAMRAAESRFVRLCERKAIVFGGAWEELMRMGMRVMGEKELPPEMYRMETIWADPSTPTYAAKADAAAKLYANGAGVIPRERARIDIGYSEAERLQMREWDQDEEFGGLSALYNTGKLLPSGSTDPTVETSQNSSETTQTGPVNE